MDSPETPPSSPAPPAPGRTELAAPVPGGWVQILIDATFTPSDQVTDPEALRTAADHIRSLDPDEIRQAASDRLIGLRADPYAAAQAVIADMIEQAAP